MRKVYAHFLLVSMDLGSSLEQQQGFENGEYHRSQLHHESHELPELPRAKKNSPNVLGAVINTCFSVLFCLVFCCAISAMSIFVAMNNTVMIQGTNITNTTGGCILFASNNNLFEFGDGTICNYVLWGLVAIVGVGFLYCLISCGCVICNIAIGLTPFNFLTFVALIISVFCSLTSLSIGVLMRLGRTKTCDSVHSLYPESVRDNVSNCSNPLLVDNNGNEASFSSFLFGSEMIVWATTILLIIITLLCLGVFIGFLIKCYISIAGKRVNITSDDEPSPFSPPKLTNDEDDEPMLDPSGDIWNSSDDNHTSFPPYVTGSSANGSGYEPARSDFSTNSPWS